MPECSSDFFEKIGRAENMMLFSTDLTKTRPNEAARDFEALHFFVMDVIPTIRSIKFVLNILKLLKDLNSSTKQLASCNR